TLREFAGRQLRWARLRRHLNLGGYLGEVLLNPVFLSLLGLLAFRSARSVIVAGLALALISSIHASTEHMLGVRRPVWLHPPLELARSAVCGVLWFVALFSRTVVWRGNVLALSARRPIEVKTRAEIGVAVSSRTFDPQVSESGTRAVTAGLLTPRRRAIAEHVDAA